MTTEAETYNNFPSGFNWGAFLFTPIFLLTYSRVGTAIALFLGGGLLGAVLSAAGAEPVGWIISLLVSGYFGTHGNEIAWATGRFASEAALRKSMRRWNVVSAVFAALLVALFAVALLSD